MIKAAAMLTTIKVGTQVRKGKRESEFCLRKQQKTYENNPHERRLRSRSGKCKTDKRARDIWRESSQLFYLYHLLLLAENVFVLSAYSRLPIYRIEQGKQASMTTAFCDVRRPWCFKLKTTWNRYKLQGIPLYASPDLSWICHQIAFFQALGNYLEACFDG